ncbi:glycosyltransferase family 2 protein [Tessaracoccus massiliensis]|uniref:glycosyltransferase family 2 protein n=1 Tax=Tessaracoccus massiliensis TaxID=1522311 RepID=UPI00058C1C1D|nr:galactosyltransferase-related protein [Tessaracoccus massiliensis]
MELGIVTIVHGRHTHLARQLRWVAALDPAPLVHVVVSMGDAGIKDLVPERERLLELPPQDELPLAAARNRGVGAAEEAGCTAVALLDVDCLPEASFVADYAALLKVAAKVTGPSVVAGRVRYLPEGLTEAEHTPRRLAEVGRDHPLRVVPDGDDLLAADVNLLWSLNIATTVTDWHRIGGFDERYVGYGGEDTDFGRRLRAAGGHLWWARGAGAFHQWHPSSSPPIGHAASIVRNANLFHSLWGDYPMEGWLEAMAESGHVRRTTDGWAVV